MKKLKEKGKVFVLSAPSGTGKSTIVKRLMRKNLHIKRSVSYTTRLPRKGETDKKDYFFITPSEFKRKIKKGFFVEWAVVHGHYYGTSHSFINKVIKGGGKLLLLIDTQGAFQIRRKYARNSTLIFILPPSMKELEKRLRKRRTETAETIFHRLQTAKKEIRKIKYYDYVVVNDKLEKAVREIKNLITQINKNSR